MWTARDIANAVLTGRRSAAEVLEATLRRVDAGNPVVNAITQLSGTAKSEAALLDARRESGEPIGALAGVPVTVKENIAVGGMATTHGARLLEHNVAARDAPPVARLRAAGAIVVGHTNMPTMTVSGMHTRSELFGDTVNPWRADRTPGGTSGGDAVAVATGLAAVGLGNDSGGSLRLPANFCGVTALKPTPGRYAADHRIGVDEPTFASQWFPVDGPIARTVDDLALIHEVLCGADPADPRAVPVPARLPTDAPLTVAVITDPGGGGVSHEVSGAVRAAADALSRAGYGVEEIPALPALERALHAYGVLVNTEFGLQWNRIAAVLSADDRTYQELAMKRQPPATLEDYIKATGVLLGVRRAWGDFAQRYPLVLGPVFDRPAPEPQWEKTNPEANLRYGRAMALNIATTCAGLPAVAVPTGVCDSIPTGVQIVARPFREDECLSAAAAVEATCGVLSAPLPAGMAS
jgi:amidase